MYLKIKCGVGYHLRQVDFLLTEQGAHLWIFQSVISIDLHWN